MMKVGVTGGIGSGKSTVCRLFAEKGVAVYDTDAAAKRLMRDDPKLREAIVALFGAEAYCGDEPDRAWLAQRVFTDPEARGGLEALVHPAVMRDFEAWTARQAGDYVILESAILFERGLDRRVDRTLAVLAPRELRVERTCRRDGCDAEKVAQRMAAQFDDDQLAARADYTLVNIFEEDLAPAVTELDRLFCHEAKRF